MAPRITVSVDSEVGADKRVIARTSNDPRVKKLIDHTVENGYVIIENAFSKAQVEETKAELARISNLEDAGPAVAHGRNSFEGFKTSRNFALLNKSKDFEKYAIHPDVLALNDHFLDPAYLLSLAHSISIQPGEDQQTIHQDDGYILVERPHPPFVTAIMVALDDYTATNGSTVVIPKSHTWGSDRLPKQSEAEPVIMPAGSIVYYVGTLYHGGGKNTSDKIRHALTVQYCQPWVRPVENQILAVDWDRLADMPRQLVDLLGFKVARPFIGHVDGRSPRSVLPRLIEKFRTRSKPDTKL
ncbi:hypothetical protein NQ176_g9714 [Zarea fungicola]|uniref:Uncharacterized protein n=1 Tax=Zarea fungicola TaxID=93591 RepID=A0ACC1MLV9_9HYPO|nr:hypothetical protein NQ176_g9714 [Lecanicillium fungicola]